MGKTKETRWVFFTLHIICTIFSSSNIQVTARQRFWAFLLCISRTSSPSCMFAGNFLFVRFELFCHLEIGCAFFKWIFKNAKPFFPLNFTFFP
jgi:hypothetical protein